AQTEAVGIFLRRQPVAIVRRRRILLPGEQPLDPRRLAGRRLQPQPHSADPTQRIHPPLVVLRMRSRRPVALQRNRPEVVTGLGMRPGCASRAGALNRRQETRTTPNPRRGTTANGDMEWQILTNYISPPKTQQVSRIFSNYNL